LVIFVLTGSSGSGKSTIARALNVEGLEIHDSDEDGVPENVDTAWRQRSIERWLQAAAASSDRDLLVTGQSPLGEVLAAPSAPHLDAIAVALVEVDDRSRFVRLEQRDPGKWSREAKRDFVGWARWHRAHAADPHHAPEVLTTGTRPAMRWDRWNGWEADDPRWRTEVFDTTQRTVEESAEMVADWIAKVRCDPAWPLRSGWHSAEL
jgi:energy-coupling factor transporter ATP-binding protein EcfA2